MLFVYKNDWEQSKKRAIIIDYFPENKIIPTELRKDALYLQSQLEFDDKGAEGVTTSVDDEYKWVGVDDPKIMVTTSHDPSSKLKQFAKVKY